ncbi:unnamed protein product (macronuclear) [Paramecium tetraurelia]|uniref:BZIP domain-containing protein n=1 Tax=Paramecium tetraurelia TaxID=5888 RepID=A0DWF7_PARTE|nr:uncharacterized protein GSPATT00021016001 [Paramecium tetraurelia]CAK87374.1 unnamed protein product [Paramecium tetraurelia]|eukprot:XP_001454771.1 hypothetical protein (macronuclear) [Paramecium tetraurelia strain d4-2]
MQIASPSSKAIYANLELKNSESQNIEFICQELKTICTVSYQLISPKISQKPIKMKKLIKKVKKNGISKQGKREKQNKQSIHCLIDAKEELKYKIALVNDLQSQLLYLKMMISKM